MKFERFGYCLLLVVSMTLPAHLLHSQQSKNVKPLKEVYSDHFTMGVAISPRSTTTDEASLIRKHFASVTAENAMKMAPIHPEENRYNWAGADSIVNFAILNKQKIRGHTLCWDKQAPAWMFVDKNGIEVSKDVLLKRLKDHITAVVTRYKGKVYAWDVVNEAVSDNHNEYLRNSKWLQICGEDYIIKAFEFAHAADPGAELYYNDYNENDPVKREKIIRLVQSLQDKGVPIHGIGLQAHWSIYEPTREALDSTIRHFAQLGLKVHITELDLSVYPKQNQGNSNATSYDTTLSRDKELKQQEAYRMVFEVFRKYSNIISAVTFWNISDRHSWLDNFPVRGRKDFPLLFDRELQPKSSFFEVIEF